MTAHQLSVATQQDAERSVRLLLHRARKPRALSSLALVTGICTAVGVADPVAAMRRLVDEALKGDASTTVRLRDLIYRCDLDGTLSLDDASLELGYSRRHFQRYRAHAVSLIADYLRKLLDPMRRDQGFLHPLQGLADIVADREPLAATELYGLMNSEAQKVAKFQSLAARVHAGVELFAEDWDETFGLSHTLTLALVAQSKEINGKPSEVTEIVSEIHRIVADDATAFDWLTCFELEWVRYTKAKNRSDAFGMASAARALERMAAGKVEWQAPVLIAKASAAIRAGDLCEASSACDLAAQTSYRQRTVTYLAFATLLQSQIAFLRSEFNEAVELGRGASIALRAQPVHNNLCQHVIQRAKLALGESPDDAEDLSLRPAGSWDRLCLETLHARGAFARGDAGRAFDLATTCYEHSLERDYYGLVAQNAATIAAVHLQSGDARSSQTWANAAYAHTLRTADHWLGHDLFSLPGFMPDTGLEVTSEFERIIFERLAILVPQLAHDDIRQREATRNLIAAVFAYARKSKARLSSIDDATDAVNETNAVLAHYFAKCAPAIRQLLVLAGTILLPYSDRPAFAVRIGEAVAHAHEQCRPGARRLFLVG